MYCARPRLIVLSFAPLQRSTILNLLADAGCSSGDMKLVGSMLLNPKLKLKVAQLC